MPQARGESVGRAGWPRQMHAAAPTLATGVLNKDGRIQGSATLSFAPVTSAWYSPDGAMACSVERGIPPVGTGAFSVAAAV